MDIILRITLKWKKKNLLSVFFVIFFPIQWFILFQVSLYLLKKNYLPTQNFLVIFLAGWLEEWDDKI